MIKKVLTTCHRSDAGIRPGNEDACGVWQIPNRQGTMTLLAVADGLGGHPAGEVASRIAIRQLHDHISQSLQSWQPESIPPLENLVCQAFDQANRSIILQGYENPAWEGMGTTLVAAVVQDSGACIVGNIGDSRAYLLGEKIQRVTRDHSRVWEMVESGQIDPKTADHHPLKNIVTRTLGREEDRPDIFHCCLNHDRLLLCSDGLIDGLSEEEINRIAGCEEIPVACIRLVDAAKLRSRDNITVILAGWS